jgi:hypothetical protein
MRTLYFFLSSAFAALTLGGCGGVDVLCDPGPCGTGGSSSSSASATGASATSSTGASGGAMCGGLGNIQCCPTEFCDFPDDTCGAADGGGTCKPRTTTCPEIFSPTCACDGKVYGNPCEANAAGADVNDNGNCPAPMGKFGCGSSFCDTGISYCRRLTSDVGGEPSSFECKTLPPSCGLPASCGCLSGETCGQQCSPTSDGKGLIVTCLGG